MCFLGGKYKKVFVGKFFQGVPMISYFSARGSVPYFTEKVVFLGPKFKFYIEFCGGNISSSSNVLQVNLFSFVK